MMLCSSVLIIGAGINYVNVYLNGKLVANDENKVVKVNSGDTIKIEVNASPHQWFQNANFIILCKNGLYIY